MKSSLHFVRTTFVCLLGLTVFTAHASTEDLDILQSKLGNNWVMVKNDKRRNIQTYLKQEDGKRYRSFKVEAVLDGTLEAAMRVILDHENYTKWDWEVTESKRLQQVSATEYYYYLKHGMPVNLPDRDVVLRAVITPQQKPSDPLILNIKAVPNFLPENPPLVRMPAEDMLVEFTPLPNNRVNMVAEGYADPGGHIPVWASNYVQRIAPYHILLGLLRRMNNDTYRNNAKPLPFKVYNTPDGS